MTDTSHTDTALERRRDRLCRHPRGQLLPPASTTSCSRCCRRSIRCSRTDYQLDFGQIGLLTLAFQVTASLLQPVIGMYTDKRPLPYSLPVGMGSSLVGLILLAYAAQLLPAARRRGADRLRLGDLPSRNPRASRGWPPAAATGSRSRCSRSAAMSARRSARCSPPSSWCRAARRSVAWFAAGALVGIIVLCQVGSWYAGASQRRICRKAAGSRCLAAAAPARCLIALVVLALLTFTKNIYMASLSSYYTFYVIEKFGVSVQDVAAACCSCSSARRRSASCSAGRSATASGRRS